MTENQIHCILREIIKTASFWANSPELYMVLFDMRFITWCVWSCIEDLRSANLVVRISKFDGCWIRKLAAIIGNDNREKSSKSIMAEHIV